MRSLAVVSVALVVAATCATALAQTRAPDAVRFRADTLEADPSKDEVALRGRVVVAFDRWRLRSDELRLARRRAGFAVDGTGVVAACPCPDPPVSLAFSGAELHDDGDLDLEWPRLRVGSVPVLVVPWLRLVPADRAGFLPPLIALRADDGLLLGSGVHLPWRTGSGELSAVDVVGGGYTSGGGHVGVGYRGPIGPTRVEVDRVNGTRVAVDSRGATRAPDATLAWEADAARGDRGRSGAVDLEAAARPFDTARVEAAADAGGALLGVGGVLRAPRGQGEPFVGPAVFAAATGGELVRWESDAAAVLLAGERAGTPIALGRFAAEAVGRPGPLRTTGRAELRARHVGAAAAAGTLGAAAGATTDGATDDVLVGVGGAAELPLSRAFAAPAGRLVHTVAPVVDGRVAVGARRGAFLEAARAPTPQPPASDGGVGAWLVGGGVDSSLSRGAGGARLALRLGGVGDTAPADVSRSEASRSLGPRPDVRLVPVAHATLAADGGWAAFDARGALAGLSPSDRAVGAAASTSADEVGRGAALLARARLGSLAGPSLAVAVAGAGGAGAGAARRAADGSLAALVGDDVAFLDATGWTAGLGALVPLGAGFALRSGADGDLSAATLLAVRGAVLWSHRCGCLALELAAAHREGRPGVDAWATIDLVPGLPPR